MTNPKETSGCKMCKMDCYCWKDNIVGKALCPLHKEIIDQLLLSTRAEARGEANKEWEAKVNWAREYIKDCLHYCEIQNGRDYCKNCGLDNEVLEALSKKEI